MYGVNQNTQDVVRDEVSFPAGVHESVVMQAVFEKLSDDKDPLLQLEFTKTIDIAGKQKTYKNREVIWPIDENNVKANILPAKNKYTVTMSNGKKVTVEKNTTPSPDVALARAYNAFNSKIKHILGVFLPESECVVSGKNYAEFCQNFIKKLEKTVNDPFRLLIEFDKDGKYTGVPKYGAFMERTEIPEEHSELYKQLNSGNIRLRGNVGSIAANTPQGAPGMIPETNMAPPAAPPAGPPVPPAPPK
jgi:hypothetical protein